MKYIYVASIALLVFIQYSCNHATNRNAIFTNFDPSSTVYKSELIKQIATRKPQDLTFTFNKCLTIAGKDYLAVNVKGDAMEASGLILVNTWNKLENLKRTKGIGYSGAKLKNLVLDVDYDDGQPILVYKDMDKIID